MGHCNVEEIPQNKDMAMLAGMVVEGKRKADVQDLQGGGEAVDVCVH